MNLRAWTETDASTVRRLVEPGAAALELPHYADLMDLGSGGGSPAIPLALALESPRLVMVESKIRKAAFLGEASRAVGLTAAVEPARFEDVANQGTYGGRMSLVSIRAVRVDRHILTIAKGFLKPGGKIALFSPTPASPSALPGDLPVGPVPPPPPPSPPVLLRRLL